MARAPRLPLSKLESPADCQRLAAWCALEVLRGRLPAQRVQMAKAMLAEFRQAFKDSGILEQFEQLKATVARLTAAKGTP